MRRDKVSSTTEGPVPAMPTHAFLTDPGLNKGAGWGPADQRTSYQETRCKAIITGNNNRYTATLNNTPHHDPSLPGTTYWDNNTEATQCHTATLNNTPHPPTPWTIVAWNHLLRQHSPLQVLQVCHCLGQAPISSSATTAFWSSQPVAPDFWMSNDMFSKNSNTHQTTKDFISRRDSDSRHVGFSRILMK